MVGEGALAGEIAAVSRLSGDGDMRFIDYQHKLLRIVIEQSQNRLPVGAVEVTGIVFDAATETDSRIISRS